jgi:hypothetical protein
MMTKQMVTIGLDRGALAVKVTHALQQHYLPDMEQLEMFPRLLSSVKKREEEEKK